jgi:hypothetical protein
MTMMFPWQQQPSTDYMGQPINVQQMPEPAGPQGGGFLEALMGFTQPQAQQQPQQGGYGLMDMLGGISSVLHKNAFSGNPAMVAARQGQQKFDQEQQTKSKLAQIAQEYQTGQIDQGTYLQKLAVADPEFGMKMALKQAGVDAPSAIQEWNTYNSMSPEDQARYLNMKRANQIVNLGGTQAVVNPTGQIQQQFPVTIKPDNAPELRGQQASATAAGTIAGEDKAKAVTALPVAEENVSNSLNLLRQLVGDEALGIKPADGKPMPEHPGLRGSVGGLDSRTWNVSDEAVDFNALLEQAKGGAFLTAIEQMRGLGALSNAEGQAATQATTRMSTAMSEEGFKKAAKEYADVMKRGVDRLKTKVGNPAASAPAAEPDVRARYKALMAKHPEVK